MNETFNPNISGYAIPVSILCAKWRSDFTEQSRDYLIADMMGEEGLSFQQFAKKLRDSGRDGRLEIKTSQNAHSSFEFIEKGYFDRIDHPCNKIKINAEAADIQPEKLAGPLKACQRAVIHWPNAITFSKKLEVAIEQATFGHSMESCEDIKSSRGYVAKYPNGRYIREATAFLQKCNLPTADKSTRP